MKYNQPYGVSDPNAPYINGNPSTGTMGSIPPAAAVEHPQREIANFISDSALTPTDTDLRQMSKSIQSGKVTYAADTGTPNFITITPAPAVAAYAAIQGARFAIKIANVNTTMVKINVSGLGFIPLVHRDGTELGASELIMNSIVEVVCDAVANRFQLLTGAAGGLIFLTQPRTIYVDDALGNDTAYDGSTAAVDATHGHGPFKTLTKALNVMATYNLSGFTFTIKMADGNYTSNAIIPFPVPNGSGTVSITGNANSPSSVKLINAGSGSVMTVNGGNWNFLGVEFIATAASPSDEAIGMWAQGAATIWLYNVAFGYCPGAHFAAAPGGLISVFGPIHILGSSRQHMLVMGNGIIWNYLRQVQLFIETSVAFSQAFASGSGGGQMSIPYGPITYVGGATVTGPRYFAVSNAVIDTGGGGATYLPGSTAGSLSYGGQYL